MVLAGVHGCDLHCKGHRLKIGQEGMVGHVASTGQCAMRPTCARIRITLAASTPRSLKSRSRCAWASGWSASSPRRIPSWTHFPAAIANSAGVVRSRCGGGAQRAAVPGRTRRARRTGSRRAGSARHSAGVAAEEFSIIFPGFAISGRSVPARAVGGDWYDFIPFPDGRWGLVLGRCFGERNGGSVADVGYSRHAAVAGRSLLQSGRSADPA